MRIDEIRRLIKLVEESQVDELEVRRWWTHVRIQKKSANHHGEATVRTVTVSAPPAPAPAPVHVASPTPAPAGREATTAASATDAAVEAGLIAIRSPMVGTFYRAPSPQSPPYVDVGARVVVGQVVCIVEAMKLMNEIESEVAGAVQKILVENGAPVEFNQPLFLVKPD